MAVRPVIRIDEEKCTGCGLCVPACAEGAIQIVDGKARLVSEVYCDGLGACLGECPEGAIAIEEREAVEFDEEATREHLTNMGRPAPKHVGSPVPAGAAGQQSELSAHFSGCPGSRPIVRSTSAEVEHEGTIRSRLSQWPVQLTLVPPAAPYFQGADLLITADCVPFAYADYHRDFLDGKAVVVGCPKLDDLDFYIEKLTQIFKLADIRSVTVLNMEVPCCFGIVHAARAAIEASGKSIPISVTTIGIDGGIKADSDAQRRAAARGG